jgi:hypothetical protein
VVIPTRNRPHLLPFALRTSLDQEHDDFEVVVSDNDGPPLVRDVVEGLADPRVKYVRTPGLLSLADSWEFAVRAASGEFVTVLHDDDGLLLHALAEADRALSLTGARLLRWETGLYAWPSLAGARCGPPDRLKVPLRQERGFHAVHRVDGAATVRAAAGFDAYYTRLPMISQAVAHRSLIEELRRRTGRLFRGSVPDVYSGFALAHVAGELFSLNAPLGLTGASGDGVGVGNHYTKEGTPASREARRLSREAGQAAHPWVPDLRPVAIAVGRAFLDARAALFPDDRSLVLDRRRLVEVCLHELDADTEGEWHHALAECRRSLADDAGLLAWFDATHAGRPRPVRPATPPRRYGGDHLYLDAAEFGVSDVYQAVRLCERLLGYRRDGLNVRLVPDAPGPAPLPELEAKEAVIRELAAAADERLQVIEQLTRRVARLERSGGRAWWRPWRAPGPDPVSTVVPPPDR